MSWHLGDWLSFAQATAATLAIGGAYGVVFYQDHLGNKHDVKRRKAVRSAIVEIATKARDLTNEVGDPMSVYGEIGTWEQYRAFRARQFMEYHDLVVGLSGQDIAEIDLLDIAMKLRVNLSDMGAIVAESNFNSFDGWNSSLRMIGYCKMNFHEIVKKLGTSKESSKKA